MPSWMYFSVSIISTLLFPTVNAVSLTIPSQITIDEQSNNQMTASCSNSDPILAIEIGKKNQNNENNPIVQVLATNPDTVIVKDATLQQRMTQRGSISSGNLQFTLSNLVCGDAGRYYCSVTVTIDVISTQEDTQNVTTRTSPGTITMLVNPRRSQYDVGELIEFNCNGQIGNQFNENNMAGFWQWQWRYLDGGTWTSYPNANNITYEAPTSAGNCQYTGRSRLYHTVTLLDNGRQFRCFVANDPENGDNRTVYTETPPVTGNPDTAGGESLHEAIKMTVSPDKKAYDIDSNVEFTCSGVSSNKCDVDMVKEWVWEWLDKNQWIPLSKSDPRIGNKGPTSATNCTFTSALSYTIGSCDHGRQFRCYLKEKEKGATRNIYLVGMVQSGNTPEISNFLFVTIVTFVILFQY